MAQVGRVRYVEVRPNLSRDRARGTLVLLHAFPLDARMWEPQLTLAERGWRIVAPHLPSAVTAIDECAGDVVDLLDALHIEDAVICGLSMGGYVSFALLRLAPNYVRALVLADTRPQADTPDAIEGRKRMLKLLEEKDEKDEKGESGPSAIADEMIPRLLGVTTRTHRPDIVEFVRSLVVANTAEAIAGWLRALMSRPDSTPLLSGLRIPTLIVVGEEDAVTPPELSEAMQRSISGSELVVIPAAGHLSSLEQPGPFNEALTRFLSHRV